LNLIAFMFKCFYVTRTSQFTDVFSLTVNDIAVVVIKSAETW